MKRRSSIIVNLAMKEAFYYLRKYGIFTVFLFVFSFGAVSAQLIPPSSLDKQTRVAIFPEGVSGEYSLYDPLLQKYVQKNNTLDTKETALSVEQWGKTGVPLVGADRQTLYHLIATEKNGTVQAPISFIYNECPTAVTPTKTTSTQVVYLHIDPNGNPDYTRYAIHVLEKNQFVQLDGSLGNTPAWVTLDRWETKDGIVIKTANASTYTYRVKARGLSGQETAYSEPMKPSVCDYYSDVRVSLTAYEEPKGILSNPALQKTFSWFSFLVSLLDMLAWLLFLWGLFFFAYYLTNEGKSKKKSKKIFCVLIWVFISLSLILVAKYYFFFTQILYTKKAFLLLPQQAQQIKRPLLSLPLNVEKGTLVRYTITLQNSDQARSYVTLYQPLAVTYIPESLSINGTPQTDARDEDTLWYDATTNRIGIKLQSLDPHQTVNVAFVTQE